MRIKLDENLPARLAGLFRDPSHDVDTVVQEGLQGFADERRYPPGTHRGIMVLRLSDDRSSAVAERLVAVFATESVEAWSGRP